MNKPTTRWMKEQGCLHIEARGCIINIRPNLTDMKGRAVTSIEIKPDTYSGEPRQKLYGTINNRVVELKTKKRCMK